LTNATNTPSHQSGLDPAVASQVHAFHSIGKALTSSLNLPEILNIILEQISSLFNPTHWSLLLLDEQRQELRFEIVVGEGSEALQGTWVPLDRGVAGWVASRQEMVLCDDVRKDPRFAGEFDQRTGFETRSIVAVPLASKGRTLGVIELINILDKDGFGELGAELLSTLADYAAIAIENARAVQRIRELTVTDDVTSLFNARYLQQALEQEYRRSKRQDTPLSLVFVDVDYFKRINDSYGHLIGSEVLRETGAILTENLRATDVATRYGGDEFVVLLPETTQAEALVVTERFRKSVKAHTFGLAQGVECRITASFGVATIPDDTDDKVDLVRLADQAMYYVKEQSRDAIATVSDLRL